MMTEKASPTPHHGVVKFMPPNACRVELSFFEKLYEMKLNEMKLDVNDLPISAFLRNSEMVLTAESLKSDIADSEGNAGDK